MTFDLAVIGGGVVGCALFRRFALGGLKTILLERAPDILAGASKANSAMLHTGFDAPTGSLEQACIQAGHAEYLAIRGPLNLPLLETRRADGRLDGGGAGPASRRGRPGPCQWRFGRAPDRRRRSRAGASLISRPMCWVRRHRAARASDRSLVRAAGLCAASHGAGRRGPARLRRDRRRFRRQGLAPGHHDGPGRGAHRGQRRRAAGRCRSKRSRGRAPSRSSRARASSSSSTSPRARLITACIMPVPSERTKGVMVARTIFGNLLVGPTAEEQEDREHAAVDRCGAGGADRPGPAHPAGAGERDGHGPLCRDFGRPPSSRTTRSRPCAIATGSPRPASAPPASPARWASPCTRRRSIAGISASFASSLPLPSAVPNLAEHLPRRHAAPGYGEIDLPLRAGDAGRDRGCPGRAAARRAISAG